MPYLNKGQETILDALLEKNMGINDLIISTGLSNSYVRNTLRYLEGAGQVEKVDERIPYIFRIPLDDPRVKLKELIQLYENKLLIRDTSNSMVKFLMDSKLPTDKWAEYADDFEAVAHALRNLDKTGRLIETLAD